MTFQFIYFDVLVILSFMFARLGSNENGFFDIFIYLKSITLNRPLTIDFLSMFMSLAM
jgi:hypothetical protein